MITSIEIKQKAERKYFEYLRNIVRGLDFSPIEIICDKKASSSMAVYQKELSDIRSLSKEVKGYGYTVEWKTTNTKALGVQDLPSRVLFDCADDYERFLMKKSEVTQFRKDVLLLYVRYPNLLPWIEKYPQKIIENTTILNDLLKVLEYFSSNPRPQLYIRELPIEVHTKFIERNKAIIKELLDIVIADYVDNNEKDFEKHFGLLYDEPDIRIRILDHTISSSVFGGIDDITMPVSRFLMLKLPISKVFVVENKVNFLTFPSVQNSIVIWGHGYGVTSLKGSELVNADELYYWGDLDAQGFEILSQFRGYFPQTKNLLMDRSTFEKYFENDNGKPSNVSTDLNLTEEENSLYEYLKSNNYRLEQEKIPHKYLLSQLNLL